MDGAHPIVCPWAELHTGLPRGAVVGRADGYGNNCLVRRISRIFIGDRAGAPDSGTRARCASVRETRFATYGCDPNSELELSVWRHLIAEEIGKDPAGWNVLCWPCIDSGSAAADGEGGMCARLLRAIGTPGHFAPVWVEEPPVRTGGPNIRHGAPLVPGVIEAERGRRLARDRKVREAHRLAPETAKELRDRMDKERFAQRRSAGTHEPEVAARPQKRRAEATHEPAVAERSEKRRAEGAHEPDVAARSPERRFGGTHDPDVMARYQKRRVDGTREPEVAARPRKRRVEGTHEPVAAARPQKRRVDGTRETREEAARSQKRRADGSHEPDLAARPPKRRADDTHENTGARDIRRDAIPARDNRDGDAELELRYVRYGPGVAYLLGHSGDAQNKREQRHGRMRHRARRTGRGPNWRDEGPMADRAAEVGVELKELATGKEAAPTRVNRKIALAKEAGYLATHPAPPPLPASPPIDIPEELRGFAERAPPVEQLTGEFSIGACGACKETRLNATYRDSKDGVIFAPVSRKISMGLLQSEKTHARHGATPSGRRATNAQPRSPT